MRCDNCANVPGLRADDPDFPSHKANHRQFLSDKSKFKEVVPIKDPEIKKKIHWTYRLQYLKDVVLARILDDPTFSVLNSLIFFNQVDILQHLQSNQAFLKELFSIFHSEDSEPSKKKNGVLFIQQCCSIAKNLQGPARTQLYTHFIQNGLFIVIDFALLHEDASVRIAGTDVLVAMIDHDSAMMRAFIFRQINDKQKPLTDTLIELLLGEQDLGVKAQIADAIRVLLDPSTGPQIEGLGKASDITLRLHARTHTTDHETENFLKNFYDESAKKLFMPLSELSKRTTRKALFLGGKVGVGGKRGDQLLTVLVLGDSERLIDSGSIFVFAPSGDTMFLRSATRIPGQIFPSRREPTITSGAATGIARETS